MQGTKLSGMNHLFLLFSAPFWDGLSTLALIVQVSKLDAARFSPGSNKGRSATSPAWPGEAGERLLGSQRSYSVKPETSNGTERCSE